MSALWIRLRWLMEFWRPYPHVIAAIVTLTVINAFLVMAPPAVLQVAIDRLPHDPPQEELIRYGLILVGLAIAQALTYGALQTSRAWMNLTLEWNFRQRAFEALVRLSPRFFGAQRTGDLVTRLTDDVSEKLMWFSCSGMFRTLEAMFRIVVGLAAMSYLSPKLTLITVAPLPLIILVFFATRKALQGRFDRRQTAISTCGDVVASACAGIRVVKSTGHIAPLERQFGRAIDDRKGAEVEAVGAEVLVGSLYGQTWQIAMALALVAGGWMAINGETTLGVVVAMLSYVGMLVWPMIDFGQFLVGALRASVSIDRLRELEDAPREVSEPDAPQAPEPHGALQFDSVTVALGQRPALAEVSFDVEPGARTAVVGPVGAGKSVLARLVPRLLDPDQGDLRLDGVSLAQWNLDRLRQAVAYVPQDPALFAGTVRDNVRAGRDLDDDRLRWACRVACLEQDLETWTDGWDTVVGAGGVRLSGGQKQRVGLARALAGRPRVLVLDDCTASLDADTEAALWDALADAVPGVTVLMSTHRTKTLETVDAVVVLDGGRVAQRGTHPELIVAEGPYRTLYRRAALAEG